MSDLDRDVALEVMGLEVDERAANAVASGYSVWTRELGIFEPSTNIADAWRVVERMRELGFHHECTFDRDDGNSEPSRFEEKTAPEAICNAALAAVRAPREEG